MVSRWQKSRLIATAVAIMLCVGAVEVIAPTSAYASSPQCTTTVVAHGTGEDGDTGVPLVVPASAGGSINCWMAKGDHSAAVTALQQAMNACNEQVLAYPGDDPYVVYPLKVDGQYGSQTFDAVWDVQYAHQISKDGVYGSQTRSNMEWPTTPGWDGASCGSSPS